MMFSYPIELTPDDNGTFLVTCPLLPIVATFGEDETSAQQHALDAIEAAIASMIDDGDDIPVASPKIKMKWRVDLPVLTSMKLALYLALRKENLTRAELSRRLNWKRESVDRLFRLDHHSRPEQLEAAMSILGKRFEIDIKEATDA
jgi:antitoxin HicB